MVFEIPELARRSVSASGREEIEEQLGAMLGRHIEQR